MFSQKDEEVQDGIGYLPEGKKNEILVGSLTFAKESNTVLNYPKVKLFISWNMWRLPVLYK